MKELLESVRGAGHRRWKILRKSGVFYTPIIQVKPCILGAWNIKVKTSWWNSQQQQQTVTRQLTIVLFGLDYHWLDLACTEAQTCNSVAIERILVRKLERRPVAVPTSWTLAVCYSFSAQHYRIRHKCMCMCATELYIIFYSNVL